MWLVIFLVGCGIPEYKYQTEVAELLCEKHAQCNDDLTKEDCLAIDPEIDRESCDYDAKAAEECRDAVVVAECTEYVDLFLTTFEPPPICDEVWVNCDS